MRGTEEQEQYQGGSNQQNPESGCIPKGMKFLLATSRKVRSPHKEIEANEDILKKLINECLILFERNKPNCLKKKHTKQ